MRTIRASLLLLSCLCLHSRAARAERPLSVQAELNVEEVLLGRPFVVHLSATHQRGSRVPWPEPLPLGPEFEELSRKLERRAQSDQLEISEAYITLMAFDTAVRALPAVELGLVDARGHRESFKTQPLPLRVTGLLNPEQPELRPMAAPVDVPVRDTRLLVIAFAVPALLLLISLVWWLSRRRKSVHQSKPGRTKTRLSPHEEALARLKALEASGALDAATLKSTYLDLSEIFRDYLGRRFGFSSLDLTTSEIQSRLLSVPGSEKWHEPVLGWLSRCDLIKYANSAADPDEAREALYSARNLIEQTRERAAEVTGV